MSIFYSGINVSASSNFSNINVINFSANNISVSNASINSLVTSSGIPYATQSYVTSRGYITSSDLTSYTTGTAANIINTSVSIGNTINASNASFTNTSIGSLIVTTINGQSYGTVSSDMKFTNLSVTGNFSMPSTGYMNVSNASFTNVSFTTITNGSTSITNAEINTSNVYCEGLSVNTSAFFGKATSTLSGILVNRIDAYNITNTLYLGGYSNSVNIGAYKSVTIGSNNTTNVSTLSFTSIANGSTTITTSGINTSNASFTNVSFITIANGSTTITNAGINTSNASFTNASIGSLIVTTINGQSYGTVSSDMTFTNVSVTGNFSMPSTAYMNVSNASFTKVSITTLTINGKLYNEIYINNISNVSNVNISNSNISVINISGNSIISQSPSNTTNGIFISCGSTMTYPSIATFTSITMPSSGYMNVSNASFTNVSFTTIANGSTTITNAGINTSNASFTNASINSLVTSSGIPYATESYVTSQGYIKSSDLISYTTGTAANIINTSVTIGNKINASNASFTNVSFTTIANGSTTITNAGINTSNASFTNVSFITIANGSTTITNAGINTSNASFTNASIGSLIVTTINGQSYGTVTSDMKFTNLSVTGNFSMPSTAYMNVSNASFTNVSVSNLLTATGITVPTSGTINAGTFNSTSDFELKENIIYLNKDYDINKLKPCTFNFKNSSITKLGFIAQDVKEIIPIAVSENNKIHSIDYSSMTTASILTIQKLIERVDYLENILKKHNLF